jgi:hypothetical protein
MSPASILSTVRRVNDAAADYAQIHRDTEGDLILRNLMLQSHSFELAKRVVDRHATKFGPTLINGTRASLCLVVNERAVFCVVCLVTGNVSIVSDERTRGAA